MTDLHKRIEELVQELHENVKNNWQTMEGSDLFDIEPEGWLRKSLTTLFKEQLEALAGEVEATKWMDDGQVANYDKENAQAFYNHNKTIDEAVEIIRSKATRI